MNNISSDLTASMVVQGYVFIFYSSSYQFLTLWQEDPFRDGIRRRDGGCVFSGDINHLAKGNMWNGFQAAHIWGLGQEDHFVSQNFRRWIRQEPGSLPSQRPINSIQNGLCIRMDLYSLFDSHMISVNVDVSLKPLFYSPLIDRNKGGI